LLSNAIKYHAPERQSQVWVRSYETADYQVLAVQDYGLGMNLSRDNKLFTMFNRLHDHVEGSGIGLYMVKKIIENAVKLRCKVRLGKDLFSRFFSGVIPERGGGLPAVRPAGS
jgi:light-regulated signal transduction histidine kinase (bacteriophytochrome)